MFSINHQELIKTQRVVLGDWTSEPLEQINHAFQVLEEETGYVPTQKGRVIALRNTDTGRLYSAFKAATYLGKYDDMNNVDRFLTKMVKAHHSYEPIRGESYSFLFVGVGKPIYDHLVTYSVGRYGRIAGGQRANLPWGLEVPTGTKDKEGYFKRNWKRIEDVIHLIGKGEESPEVKEQLQDARSELPVGYIMPPFIMEFSEEALIKNVFTQRLFEKGAQGGTVEVVNDMIECCLAIDREKWETLIDYHGPHIAAWEKVMRTLRDKPITLGQFKELFTEQEKGESVYDLLMRVYGKQAKSMWDK
jgi:hypothetical protein